MKSLTDLNKQQLMTWITTARAQTNQGTMLDYIPLLKTTSADTFAVSILALTGTVFTWGNQEKQLPLMSAVKPFLLFYILCDLGADAVFKRVGKQPSNYAFNSLTQLRLDHGFPRNPMLNSGAMVLASMLPGEDGYTCCEHLRTWLNQAADCQLELNRSLLDSVESQPNRKNQSLVRELLINGHLEDPETTLDTYNHLCCLGGNIQDLAKLGMLLVKNQKHGPIVQETMLTCGLYQNSTNFAAKVGFPTKSGVSGVVISIVPNQGAIACYSPPLDPQGNSVAALSLIEDIANELTQKS